MRRTDHIEHTEAPLGGFELRLLRSLTELDQARPAGVQAATAAAPPPSGRGRHRRSVVIAAATGAATLVGAAATATAILTLASGGETVAAGGSVVMKGSGCAAGSALTLWLDRDVPLGATTARADGLFVATVTVPVATVPGSHEVRATCTGPNGADLVQVLPLTVTEPGPPEPLDPVFDAKAGATVGGIAMFKGAGCRPDTAVTITVAGLPALDLATTAADAGQFMATGFVPADAEVGSYQARAECVDPSGQPLVQRTELSVMAPEPEPSAPATKRAG